MRPDRYRQLRFARRLTVICMVFVLWPGTSAYAATSCSSASCSTQCNPTPPVGISTLVPSSEFPAGADTPMAFIDPDDGTDRRLIPTQEGAILLWRGSDMSIDATPYLDLRSGSGGPVLSGGERGLLSMAVDPEFATTGLFYVFYTRVNEGTGTAGDVVIERYQQSLADPDTADPMSATRIMIIDHPAGNHNGGTLAFGPDGFLYISTGDGGGACDGNAGASGDGQSTSTLAGKMLRIDVRGIDPMAGPPDDCGVAGFTPDYLVPSSNPFFGMEPACDEVWALGLRNPFRFSFDRLTGDLYIADVGQQNWEEINILQASAQAPQNFGWVCREGCASAGAGNSSCSTTGCPVDLGTSCEFPRTSGFWDPALCHSNPQGWESIIAGFRYRGANVPSLVGDFIYGDANCGQIWKTDTLDPANQAAVSASCWASGYPGTYAFSEDRLGELYVVLGALSRIDCIHNGEGCPWASSSTLFEDGFESGEPPALVGNQAVLDVLPGTVSLVEGFPLLEADSGAGSLSRIPNGTDTNNAATDWESTTTVTPGEEYVSSSR